MFRDCSHGLVEPASLSGMALVHDLKSEVSLRRPEPPKKFLGLGSSGKCVKPAGTIYVPQAQAFFPRAVGTSSVAVWEGANEGEGE